ncbi:conserved hypothetical protein [Neospora caninum Liverpool]|uniref:Uncharacterized protein n=1 Tax=Neospora caninum (strain Liverpool) TaxID=572307 RepID=F0VJS2_NEOCL|nr:conserved hypothetical protein [Neospora caninum Liverpool]CBZ53983.1 conserved hypothetical protein [Neospora caninum Liverpool]CEL67984.1 TPA: hypothetical protein BN1204_037650 [Neospora caninum Liverpool]|eukprot:XP_003884015.1 conserved hypothetical protein [Neospora caninum Liverpool]
MRFPTLVALSVSFVVHVYSQTISPGSHVRHDKNAALGFQAMVGRIRSATPLTVKSTRQMQKWSANEIGKSPATSPEAAATTKKSTEFMQNGVRHAIVPRLRKARFTQASEIVPESGLEISARRIERHKSPPKTMEDLEDGEIAAELGADVPRRRHMKAPELEYAAPGAEEVLSATVPPGPSSIPSPETVAPSESASQGVITAINFASRPFCDLCF